MRVNIPLVCSECVHCSNVSFGYCMDGVGFMLYDIYPPQNIHLYTFILIKKNKRYTNTKQNIPLHDDFQHV